ncbi:MAG: hypothetical protein ACYS47_00120 [Planctomycetota bacterium]|jgi:hypothetical protein
MEKKSSGREKAAKKAVKKSKTRKVIKKPLKVESLNNLQQAMETGIQLVWDNENTLATRLEEVSRLVGKSLDKIDTLGRHLVKLSKKIEKVERMKGGGKAAAVSEDDIRKAVQGDLDDLRKKLAQVRKALKQSAAEAGGGVTLETLSGVLGEQIGAVYTRLEAVEKGGAAGRGPSPDQLREALEGQLGAVHARLDELEEAASPEAGLTEEEVKNLISGIEPEIIESKLFSKFINSNELKNLLDERFKIMRDWLKRDEIPRQIQKRTGR